AAWRALVENAPNIIQTQKMEAIGHLAVGIAHDFNNLLTAITSYIQLAMMRASPDERLHSYLEEADKASERAASLTRQLLAFSRKESVEPQTLDLNALIMEMDKLLHPLIGIGENIELWIELSAEPCLLKADRSQMEQVIMNLVINAVDAMPDGGKLTIKTGIVPGSAQSPGFEHQRHVSLEVADTGIGMDEKVKERIFEPFFTTKIPGKGTGLGLSTCYGIVTQMGGRIAVDSAPGKGAAFTVLIPQAEDAPKTL
ncbi:MAG: ATP-binding protein, partial [Chloroflexi bacterium]|nr:ATP-binding protein [Chloroflexota bacterium]